MTSELQAKIDFLKKNDIEYFFGGTLFEKAFIQGRFESFVSFAKDSGCQYIEISDGTIDLQPSIRAELIEMLTKDFKVLTEVGFKDPEKSKVFAPKDWVKTIKADFAAGAYKVITEARESGTSGICRADGEVRYGLIEEILSSGIESHNMIFETPNKSLQTYFIKKLGANVNLGNIGFEDVVALETLRLGLRSDTFFTFDVNKTEV